MNVLLEKPLGIWKLGKVNSLLTNIDQVIHIVDTDKRELRKVRAIIPTEMIRHLLTYWRAGSDAVRFEITVDGPRAYLVLHIDRGYPVTQPMFYWVKSAAPVWLRSVWRGVTMPASK